MSRSLHATLAVAALAGSNAIAHSSATIFGGRDTTVQHATQGGATANRLYGLGRNQFSTGVANASWRAVDLGIHHNF
jgi:hypothetical protein